MSFHTLRNNLVDFGNEWIKLLVAWIGNICQGAWWAVLCVRGDTAVQVSRRVVKVETVPLYVRLVLWWWMEQKRTQLNKRTIHVSFFINIVFLSIINYHKVLSSPLLLAPDVPARIWGGMQSVEIDRVLLCVFVKEGTWSLFWFLWCIIYRSEIWDNRGVVERLYGVVG
jgi:hypothetical protein